MYEVSVKSHFDAAHALREYQGKCERLHGHRFEVVVSLRFTQLNELGISYDFTALKGRLGQILDRWDHTNLNELAPFDVVNPSSENIAATIYRELEAGLGEAAAHLAGVQVWESPDAFVTYSR